DQEKISESPQHHISRGTALREIDGRQRARNLPEKFWLRGEGTGCLQWREDHAESSHRWDKPQFSHRKRLHARLRPELKRRRRRAFTPGNCRRQNDRETIVPARITYRQSGKSQRPHVHNRRCARGERNLLWPESG